MLRNVVETFLDSLTERELDAPLLAHLSLAGFYDVHFTHGAFEFGKDFVAKQLDDAGQPRQFAIQSKAGDIGLAEWRDIRPQIEEALQNTLAHPGFDTNLPRVAVLATTGRLKGGAALDAQQLEQRARAAGSTFVTWEKPQFLDWFTTNPDTGLASAGGGLLELAGKIERNAVTENELELYTRCWLDPSAAPGRPAVEAAVVANRLRLYHRLDLAAAVSLQLFRSAWTTQVRTGTRPATAGAALRLFVSYVAQLLEQVEPSLDDPNELARQFVSPGLMLTYSVACCRLVELFALFGLVGRENPELVNDKQRGRALRAVEKLVTVHPGTARPVSDSFAVALIPPAVLLAAGQSSAVRNFLARAADWLLRRYDEDDGGLGLAALAESEEIAAERLLGGVLEGTTLKRRTSSYLATVLIDLALLTDNYDLANALVDNLHALRVVPSLTAADEVDALWRRSGEHTHPQPRVDYSDVEPRAPHHAWVPPTGLSAIEVQLLSSVARTRHYVAAVHSLVP
jgi:hypothetical protein